MPFMNTIYLWFAGADAQSFYSPDKLDKSDQAIITKNPARQSTSNWQTSRALKQFFREKYLLQHYSISHKKELSLLAASNVNNPVGVDLEWMQTRDFADLIPLFCHEEEQKWWQEQQDKKWAFYQLWCLKEALIKADNLSFPSDLKRVGLSNKKSDIVLTSGCLKSWQGVVCCLDKQWMMAAVWPTSTVFPKLAYRFFNMNAMQKDEEIFYT